MTSPKTKSTKKFAGLFRDPLAAGLLARHVIATLPDSMAARRELLQALLTLTPHDSVSGDHTALLLHTLQRHETLRQNIFLTPKDT